MAECLKVARELGQVETEDELRRQICRTGHEMYAHGLVVACEGNISVRLDRNQILVTPAGACKGHMVPEDLLVTDACGEVLRGTGRPSTEMLMHLLFYRLRPNVRAVCHAHPPTATGFAVAGRALEEAILPEVIIGLGKVPLAPYGTPGSWDLCARLEPLATTYDAILLENHGVVTCGHDLATAYQQLEIVERFAKILLVAEALGGPHLLPPTEVQKLIAARSRYGVLSKECGADLPLTSEALRNTLGAPPEPFHRPTLPQDRTPTREWEDTSAQR
ncbi:MAG: class II aldolase/adducin family protein [Candidatus Acidiferrum sp.]